jgi:ribosomal protein S18 acetylase RimI-like enzyme
MPLARQLFEEYAASLDIDLCFQNFDLELETLPGAYAPPDGTIVVAYAGGEPAGCAALRKIGGGVCEMKRLYVKPAHRGAGVGRALAEEIVARAREIGYSSMKLDTLESMTEANALYLSIGFRKCAPYCYNPCEHPVYMELPLV